MSEIHKFSIKTDVDIFCREFFGGGYKETVARYIYPIQDYSSFTIPKKSGGVRNIDSPSEKIANLQKVILNDILKGKINPRPSSHGFIEGRSIKTNAEKHSGGKTFVFNIDLSDFFPSITFPRVRGIFMGKPFSFSIDVATVLAQICTFNGCLPQGACTSPVLSNYICRSLDRELQSLAKSSRSTYSRYCDDITFSFTSKRIELISRDVLISNGNLVGVGEKLSSIIKDNGFLINDKKVRLYSHRSRQEVTGLTVNEFPNVQRKYIDKCRAQLKSWEKYGYLEAQSHFYKKNKNNNAEFYNYLAGRISYIGMIKGLFDKVYLGLAKRYNKLACDIYPLLPVKSIVTNNEQLSNAVLIFHAYDGVYENQGSAFFLENGMAISCDHVRWLSEKNDESGCFFDKDIIFEYGDYSASPIKVSIFSACSKKDFSVFKMLNKDISLNCLKVAKNPASIGDDVFLVGYPFPHKKGPPSVCKTSVVTIFNDKNIDHLELNIQIRKGFSGGAVLNSRLEVVGIAIEGAEQCGGRNSAISIHDVLNGLNSKWESKK